MKIKETNKPQELEIPIFNNFKLETNSRQKMIEETMYMIKTIENKIREMDGYALVKINESISMGIQTISLWRNI